MSQSTMQARSMESSLQSTGNDHHVHGCLTGSQCPVLLPNRTDRIQLVSVMAGASGHVHSGWGDRPPLPHAILEACVHAQAAASMHANSKAAHAVRLLAAA
jgi:hypothetical protein